MDHANKSSNSLPISNKQDTIDIISDEQSLLVRKNSNSKEIADLLLQKEIELAEAELEKDFEKPPKRQDSQYKSPHKLHKSNSASNTPSKKTNGTDTSKQLSKKKNKSSNDSNPNEGEVIDLEEKPTLPHSEPSYHVQAVDSNPKKENINQNHPNSPIKENKKKTKNQNENEVADNNQDDQQRSNEQIEAIVRNLQHQDNTIPENDKHDIEKDIDQVLEVGHNALDSVTAYQQASQVIDLVSQGIKEKLSELHNFHKQDQFQQFVNQIVDHNQDNEEIHIQDQVTVTIQDVFDSAKDCNCHAYPSDLPSVLSKTEDIRSGENLFQLSRFWGSNQIGCSYCLSVVQGNELHAIEKEYVPIQFREMCAFCERCKKLSWLNSR